MHKFDLRIAENGHCTLSCSESPFGCKIDWYKDMKLLNTSYRNNMADKREEPHITIDLFDTLYILHATKNEEGNYTCTIDNVKAREYSIKVVSMAKMLNQDFIRYSIYLGFILSLTFTCYCAGLCVAWHRRTSFADPMNLNYGKKFHNGGNCERETLLNKDYY
ncbi:uncharacterized protein LOC114353072 [Ostrinia furnacalis]|uniref:uncharacterized protein LOC114353072 n=1 Tax=Ostrinia furnacalis TaxID=93504 RepID=UPI00103AB636|nr:uncharacterized protein LOC114353072 [Ostrinia furnacalis]